ncbi:uncharacterized protein LOC100904187 [Galendromus occidentalis]|uniref:Uncharacterized protein LOC100904187 n=1 Tax=Galendromus occidentalis TaxID=34638 RepID=A0AAJ6QUM8_9ACAR|nr:uncharacterized protein LOC100904187 [Galendromus occidentalis]
MKLLSTLLTFVALIAVGLSQNVRLDSSMVVDDSPKLGMCGDKLSDILIMVCKPFGGIARRKRGGMSTNPLSAYMWHRSTRELVCMNRTQSAPCFCCSKFHGPCTMNTLIANFCAQPAPEFDKYYIHD